MVSAQKFKYKRKATQFRRPDNASQKSAKCPFLLHNTSLIPSHLLLLWPKRRNETLSIAKHQDVSQRMKICLKSSNHEASVSVNAWNSSFYFEHEVFTLEYEVVSLFHGLARDDAALNVFPIEADFIIWHMNVYRHWSFFVKSEFDLPHIFWNLDALFGDFIHLVIVSADCVLVWWLFKPLTKAFLHNILFFVWMLDYKRFTCLLQDEWVHQRVLDIAFFSKRITVIVPILLMLVPRIVILVVNLLHIRILYLIIGQLE